MANRWNIPGDLEEKIRQRDKLCVYCGLIMGDKATFEHIDNDENNITPENICMCCAGCNSSKGAKKLSEWLETPYCQQKNINAKTVAEIVRKYLQG